MTLRRTAAPDLPTWRCRWAPTGSPPPPGQRLEDEPQHRERIGRQWDPVDQRVQSQGRVATPRPGAGVEPVPGGVVVIQGGEEVVRRIGRLPLTGVVRLEP